LDFEGSEIKDITISVSDGGGKFHKRKYFGWFLLLGQFVPCLVKKTKQKMQLFYNID
jgi:hypothetical protein